MKFTASILSASILAALCVAVPVHAQDTGTADANGKNDSSKVTTLATIKVVGLRQSLKKSLETERNSNAIINVITARTIGKFRRPTSPKRWRRCLASPSTAYSAPPSASASMAWTRAST